MGLDMWLMNETKGVEVAYWRKANQIRNWFAMNLDEFADNGSTPVRREDLVELKNVCLLVLKDRSKAKSLLPTSSGFFFGSTQFDEWYFEDVRYTAEVLQEVIEKTNWDTDKVQYYEWY